jgi:hypothetical protein
MFKTTGRALISDAMRVVLSTAVAPEEVFTIEARTGPKRSGSELSALMKA